MGASSIGGAMNERIAHWVIGTMIGALIGSGTALAADKPDKAAPAGQAMDMPKPAPEVAAAAKALLGTWKCSGKAFASPMGPEHKIEGSITWKQDLDKFFLVGTYAEKKTKENPAPVKFT